MKALLKTILLLTLFLNISCRFNPSTDPNAVSKTKSPQMTLYKVTEKPEDSLLIGIWEVDSFSYEFIREQIKIDNKKVTMRIGENGNVKGYNLPNFSVSNFNKPTTLVKPNGTWRLNQSYKKDRWQITISFEKKENKHYGFSGYFDIYKRNDSLFLWKFIGDPDSGNRLLFKKKD